MVARCHVELQTQFAGDNALVGECAFGVDRTAEDLDDVRPLDSRELETSLILSVLARCHFGQSSCQMSDAVPQYGWTASPSSR